VVLDNRSLGMVRQLQKNARLHFSQVDFSRGVDYPALARAFGIPGFAAKTRHEAEQALAQALEWMQMGAAPDSSEAQTLGRRTYSSIRL